TRAGITTCTPPPTPPCRSAPRVGRCTRGWQRLRSPSAFGRWQSLPTVAIGITGANGARDPAGHPGAAARRERVLTPQAGGGIPPQFFFGAMSPYSWFAAERIGSMLPDAQWRPVYAGALFKVNHRNSWGLGERR